MKYIVSSKFYDVTWTFDTREEAEEQIRKFVENDKHEFHQETSNDYYIIEEEV